jgi:hypothetical protein
VDYKTCKSQTDCTTATNSCGGYSGIDYVPGEWCTAASKGEVCCIPGQCGQGSKCATGNNDDGSIFNSATWLECKYQAGCTDAQNQCGGYGTPGEWCQAGLYTPAKKGGGLSSGAIVGIIIVALIVLIVAGYAMGSKPKNDEETGDYKLQGEDGTYLPPRYRVNCCSVCGLH